MLLFQAVLLGYHYLKKDETYPHRKRELFSLPLKTVAVILNYQKAID